MVFDALVGDLINVLSSDATTFVDLYSPMIRLKWFTAALSADDRLQIELALISRLYKKASPELVARVLQSYAESGDYLGGVAREVETLCTLLLTAIRIAESNDKFGMLHTSMQSVSAAEALVQDVASKLYLAQNILEDGAHVALSIAGRDAIAYLAVGAVTQREFRTFALRDFRLAIENRPFVFLAKFNRCSASLLL